MRLRHDGVAGIGARVLRVTELFPDTEAVVDGPVPVFDAASLVEVCARERVTFFSGAPTLLQELLQFPGRDRYDLSALRTVRDEGAFTWPEAIRMLTSVPAKVWGLDRRGIVAPGATPPATPPAPSSAVPRG